MRIVVVRDRASAGGGIYNYYEALRSHFGVDCEFVDVGRAHTFFGGSTSKRGHRRSTAMRLVSDWWALLLKLFRFPDLVHVNPGFDATTRRSLRRDAVNIWLAKLFRRPVLVFWRGWAKEAGDAAEFPGGQSGLLCRTYRSADAHIVLSRKFEEDLRRWNFSTPVYVETTVASDEVMKRAPERRTLNRGRINLLFLSRVEAGKGVLELLGAFCLLQQKHPGIYSLTIAGDGPFLKTVRDQVEARGLQDIDFPGYVTGVKKAKCYLDGSIFCFLSSHGEGMPNAVLEAIAMGLPIISSDVGGLKDILQDGITGYIISAASRPSPGANFAVEEVVDRIERIAGDEEGYRRMSEFNHRYARERFGAEKVAQRLESIYRDVLNPSRRADRATAAAQPGTACKR